MRWAALTIVLQAVAGGGGSGEAAIAAEQRTVAEIVRVGTIGKPEDLRRLRTFLVDKTAGVRMAAERILARRGDEATLLHLSKRASDPVAAVRFQALAVLKEASVLPPDARKAAERALTDGDPVARLVAIEVLATHASASSAPAVAGLLADANRDTRARAIGVLSKIRDPRAVVSLLERVESGDPAERAAVIRALGNIGGADPHVTPGPALTRQLDDENEDVRLAAVDAVAHLRWLPAVPILADLARNRSQTFVGRRALIALGTIGSDEAIGVLVEWLRAPAPSDELVLAVRKAGRRATPALTRLLGNAPTTSVVIAMGLLADSRDSAATSSLVQTLEATPTAAVAIAAADSLDAIGDPNSTPALSRTFAAARFRAMPGVREACLRALAAIRSPAAAGLVSRAIADPNPGVRAAALSLAATLHAGLSSSMLSRAISDSDAAVRINAWQALPAFPQFAGQIDTTPRGWDDLLGIERMPEALRAALANALAMMGTNGADARLIALLDRDPSLVVRAAAALAAHRRRAVTAVAAALHRAAALPYAPVAQNAATALEVHNWLSTVSTVDGGVARSSPAQGAATTRHPDGPTQVEAVAAPGAPWLAVRLVDSSGNALPYRWVRVIGQGSWVIWLRTDEIGVATLASPPAGPYRALAASDDQDDLIAATASGKSPAITPGTP